MNQGKFVDPRQDPSHIIGLLDEINKEVSAVHSRLLGLSKWKEAITGLSHDLSNVNKYELRSFSLLLVADSVFNFTVSWIKSMCARNFGSTEGSLMAMKSGG